MKLVLTISASVGNLEAIDIAEGGVQSLTDYIERAYSAGILDQAIIRWVPDDHQIDQERANILTAVIEFYERNPRTSEEN